MRVDVAVCTWNRAALLTKTLAGLVELTVPTGVTHRVLVVDNGSSDDTPSVLSTFRKKLPLVALDEPSLGHCHARNRAIAAADSDLILWTDDDVRVDRRWLAAYVRAASANANISFWGGPIEPIFEAARPAWIDENWEALKGCFADRDLSPFAIELTVERLPYGANFAVRTAVQKQFRFDTALGRRGGKALGEDELDVMRRMLAGGHCGRWVPEARVQHVIDKQRATERYVYKYFVGQGKAVARRLLHNNTNHANLPSHWRLTCCGLWHRWMYLVKRPWAPSPAWLAHLLNSALAEGQQRELYKRYAEENRTNATASDV